MAGFIPPIPIGACTMLGFTPPIPIGIWGFMPPIPIDACIWAIIICLIMSSLSLPFTSAPEFSLLLLPNSFAAFASRAPELASVSDDGFLLHLLPTDCGMIAMGLHARGLGFYSERKCA